jgi:preprotein translocase subunit SecA
MDEAMQDILALTRKKMEEAGEYGQEAYREFIEESVDYYLEKGRLSDEDDLDAIKTELMEMYEEVKAGEVDDENLDISEEEISEEKNEDAGEKINKPENLEEEE